jgi:sugar phosphate permease
MTGLFLAAIPIAGILGGPVSGAIMGTMSGRFGLANWQWVLLLEGIPSIVMGLFAFLVLADTPASAKWLTDAEKTMVHVDLRRDDEQIGPRQHGFLAAMTSPTVWLLTLIQFCLTSANPALGFWAPTIIEGFGVSNQILIGLVAAVPNLVAVACLVLNSRHSDRTLERRLHAAVPCLACAAGLAAIGLFEQHAPIAFLALAVATAGPVSAGAAFWQFPSMLLTGTAAAAGIALINSFGSVSGWGAPFIIGWLRDVTGRTAAGLYVVAGLELTAAVLILLFLPRRRATHATQGPERSTRN